MKKKRIDNAAFIAEEQQVISTIRAGHIPLVYASPEEDNLRSMLVSKIWTERM